MTKSKMPEFFINAFYESKFRNNFFVVKAGGKIIEDEAALSSLISDIKDLTMRGIKVLLIYGGGEALDRAVEERGVGTKRENGRRVTDAATLEIMKEVVGGMLSGKVYSTMASQNLSGLSLSAVPADWMNVNLRPQKPVDFGFVGDIHGVRPRPINRLFKTVDFVACACMAWAEEEKTLCNINADTIATELAIGTKAHKLIFLSDVDGVKIDGQNAPLITTDEIAGHIKSGAVTGGMQVKLENCKTALEAGVRRIHLINGLREHALKAEIFEPTGPSTMLIEANDRENYENEVKAQKLIEAGK